MCGHFQDRIHGLLLRAVDERAGIDHDHVRIFSAASQLGSGTGQHSHHHFTVDKIFWAAQADEADLLRTVVLCAKVQVLWSRTLLRFSLLQLQLRGTADSELFYRHAIFLF